MGLEAAQYIKSLLGSNPNPLDKRREGDDHLRLIKQVLLNTFPNLNGPVLATPEELNLVTGLTNIKANRVETLIFSTGATLNVGSARLYTVTKAGVLPVETVIPMPGTSFVSLPGLVVVGARAISGAVEIVLQNFSTGPITNVTITLPALIVEN